MSKEAVLAVLHRAAEDISFYSRLSEEGSKALLDYDLIWQEQAALVCGDLRWLESYIGKLDAKIVEKVVIPRLSRERWGDPGVPLSASIQQKIKANQIAFL